MLLRFLFALGVWIGVTILCLILGLLLVSIGVGAGTVIEDHASLIGFLAGLVYFLLGFGRPVVR